MNTDVPPSAETLGFLASRLRTIQDFPKPGIAFKDITPLLADPRALNVTLDLFAATFLTTPRVDVVVGIESRGFIFGAALAARLHASFVPARKPGKLPYRADRESYALEYGEATLEMHVDAIPRDARVLVVDDLLATGGTARAAARLAERQGGQVVAFAFVVELDFLGGRAALLEGRSSNVFSILHVND